MLSIELIIIFLQETSDMQVLQKVFDSIIKHNGSSWAQDIVRVYMQTLASNKNLTADFILNNFGQMYEYKSNISPENEDFETITNIFENYKDLI